MLPLIAVFWFHSHVLIIPLDASVLQVWRSGQTLWTSPSTDLIRRSIRSMSETWSLSFRVSALQADELHTQKKRSAGEQVAVLCFCGLGSEQTSLHIMSLSGYNDTEQEGNTDCSPGEYTLREEGEGLSQKACRFRRALLSFCSGLSDTNFGYHEGKPCVLLKMNRVPNGFHGKACLL